VQEIHLVASLSPDNLYSANPKHPNFVYLEQFSDKDSVLELMVYLSRNYRARVHKYTSDDFPRRQLLRSDLVVLGGPGVTGINDGNPICREMTHRVSSRIRYANDGESVILADPDGSETVLEPTYSRDGDLLRDFGYFARFPNPFNPEASVVMVNGLHTAGVLGAARVLSDQGHAARNYRVLRTWLSDRTAPHAFETVFDVETMAGDVLVPRLEPGRIFALEMS
jgi:hypothetical protein